MQVFFLCLLAGCSICWFNTVCFVLCIKNFPGSRALALSLTVSFNGVSAALYTLVANAINPSSKPIYLLLNSLLPLLTSVAALVPILRQPCLDPLPPEGVRRDSLIFLILNLLAIFTGVYLLLFGANVTNPTTARLLLSGAVFLLVFPLCIPGVVYARDWFHRNIHSSFRLEGSGFILVDVDDLELHKELLQSREGSIVGNGLGDGDGSMYSDLSRDDEKGMVGNGDDKSDDGWCCEKIVGKDELEMLGEEHSVKLLLKRLDFWLYYVAYFCGGTIGLVYSNNLGQIAQSLGQSSSTTTLVTLYSSFSFFGRLLSAAPDYIRT